MKIKNTPFKMNSMNKGLSLLAIAFLLCVFSVSAQPEGPGGGGTVGEETSVPLDGGLSVLVAAGVAYGAKKYKENKDAKKRITETI